jgi:hypothetical protein
MEPRLDDVDRPILRWFVPLAAVYVSFGVFWGVFGVAFVDFVGARQLSFAEAGNRLAGLSVVSITMMLFVSQHFESTPRRWSVSTSIVLNGAGVAGLVLLPDAWLLAAFLVLGAGTGLTDVFVNAAGQEIEARSGRPILQALHGAYAVGAGVGALATGIALVRDVPFETMILLAALSQLVAGAMTVVMLPSLRQELRHTRRTVSLSAFVAAPFLLVPAVALAAAYFVEGAIDVWGVLYLRTDLGASPAVGSWGLAAFSFAMALGRLFAARTLFHLGHRTTLIVSGLGSMLAALVALLAAGPVIASAAFLVLGFCLAATGPAAIGMVGRAHVDIGVAIAAINTLGYIGFVLGPPFMGWLADGVGIRATMVVVVVVTVAIAASGALTSRASDEARTSGDGSA